MLIHPWDRALTTAEWQDWLAGTDRFGVLAVNHRDPAQAPLVLPTHVTFAGEELLMHLARPNPVWPHLEAAAEVRLVVVGDYAYIPTSWRATSGGPSENGVPTSYYSTVQFVCRPTVLDDPWAKAAILTAQLADRQPEGGHAPVVAGSGPYGRMLPGIRGLRLAVLRVEATFTYDDQKPVEHRETVADRLDRRGRTPAPPGSSGDVWPPLGTRTREGPRLGLVGGHAACGAGLATRLPDHLVGAVAERHQAAVAASAQGHRPPPSGQRRPVGLQDLDVTAEQHRPVRVDRDPRIPVPRTTRSHLRDVPEARCTKRGRPPRDPRPRHRRAVRRPARG